MKRFRFVGEPIPADELRSALRDPAAGGYSSFEGWVRNRRDGSVEALFAGPEKSVAGIVVACRAGPGHVDAIGQRDGTEGELKLRRTGELFSVLPTA